MSNHVIYGNQIKGNAKYSKNKLLSSDTKNFDVSSINKSKKKISVKYMDFWFNFEPENLDIHRIINERYEVIISDNPDYVIFGEFGNDNYNIENRLDCVKLFLSIGNRYPDFSITDYAIGINYIENEDRYFRKPTEIILLSNLHSVYNITQLKGIDIKKKKFIAWVISNGPLEIRNKLFAKLLSYKKVDSIGGFMNNNDNNEDSVTNILGYYKFTICFENYKNNEYFSESLFDAFESGTIPIYYGDNESLEFINNRSYIHIKDESEFEEKIELIKKIDQNDTLYEEIIREQILIDYKYSKELKKYKNFIYHIFEQDKQKAKRFERKKNNYS